MGQKKRKDRKLVITMAKLCMAHASTHGARKPPGPIISHMGVSPKWVKSKKRRKERKKERKLVITMANLRMAHASHLGQQSNCLRLSSAPAQPQLLIISFPKDTFCFQNTVYNIKPWAKALQQKLQQKLH